MQFPPSSCSSGYTVCLFYVGSIKILCGQRILCKSQKITHRILILKTKQFKDSELRGKATVNKNLKDVFFQDTGKFTLRKNTTGFCHSNFWPSASEDSEREREQKQCRGNRPMWKLLDFPATWTIWHHCNKVAGLSLFHVFNMLFLSQPEHQVQVVKDGFLY